MYFNNFLKTKIDRNNNLGTLCDLLAKANISIYYYENKKWWGRKQGKISHQEIDQWDNISRSWNEKRSEIKNRIDNVLTEIAAKTYNNSSKQSRINKQSFSFQILPISLMIDMLTIENIKIYDLTSKDNAKGAHKAEARKNELKKTIYNSIKEITKTGKYKLQKEERTF